MPTPSSTAPLVGRSPLLRAEGESLAPGSARSLLVTILGELVWPTGEPVWTSTLVRLLRGLGIEEQTARQAIARGAQSGWMVPERRGREVSWSLGPRLEHIFEVGSKRVFSLSDPFEDWPGTWLSVLVTIPSTHRRTRRPLYAGLTWAGFGNPVPGLWLSPHVERVDEVRELIAELDLHEHTISLVGRTDEVGIGELEIVSRGWDLAALEEHYRMVLKAIGTLDPKPGEDTMFAFLRMISEWQELPRTDPQLPEALLPDWIGRRVAREIEERRAKWTPSVRALFSEINGS
ncbi:MULTISPECIES: PaaX family transcriptional regulator C-terminal domain-containing protein [unclassified Nocardioides]|uniref:PaaX family transcriptional regulator n=1 Tax=unclassified Nocardioides TaxID=2615069 RepID=UPI000B2D961E|nr:MULTISPECIES: PaaX family transcriptional regulator C-terminal domain-containing protein [unclassified Nocardioides]